ncbi:MAG: HesA/MoeB/ThiF family protein [Pseudomonadota bacterium]
MGEADPRELERYARHIVLREIGGPGQKRLRTASVLVIGAGGLGSPLLFYLAAAGVGRIVLADDDTVSLSNLQRQILHRTGDEGRAKIESAEEALAALNPGVRVEGHRLRADTATIDRLLSDCNMILDGSDNFETRRLCNAAAVRAGKPLIFGAIGQWEGQVAVFDPASGGPCYHCVFPEDPAPGLAPSCSEAGVLGALAGVIGSMMAVEAVKVIVNSGDPLRGRLLLYDALYAETRVIETARQSDCPVCGASAG